MATLVLLDPLLYSLLTGRSTEEPIMVPKASLAEE